MLAKLKPLAAVLIGCLTTACGTAISGTDGPTDSACRSFKIIRASHADTIETKRQIIGHNRAFETICPAEGATNRVARNG